MKKTTLSLLLYSTFILSAINTNAADFKKQVNSLHYASSIGESSYIEKLIEDDPSLLSQFNDKGLTPLQVAITNNKIKSLDTILKFDANPNIKDGFGTPSLILAIKDNNSTAVDKLLKAGAKIEIKDKKGKDARYYAKKASEKIKRLIDPPKKHIINKIEKKENNIEIVNLKKEIEKIKINSKDKIDYILKSIEKIKKEKEIEDKKVKEAVKSNELTDLNILDLENTIDKQSKEIENLKADNKRIKNNIKIIEKSLVETTKIFSKELSTIKERQVLGMYNDAYGKDNNDINPILKMNNKSTKIINNDDKKIIIDLDEKPTKINEDNLYNEENPIVVK